MVSWYHDKLAQDKKSLNKYYLIQGKVTCILIVVFFLFYKFGEKKHKDFNSTLLMEEIQLFKNCQLTWLIDI